ncbi:MAG TPA: alpha/beta fold hydrolase [Xanthomonadaceae bacterium]|nr:alpha/beta fold hydrolase [Xanthomonadaceae bacterium]
MSPSTSQTHANERVILLHGLWLRGAAMSYLARRLSSHGFDPEVFDFATVRDGIDVASERLREHIHASGSGRVHLVGHSLGGLIAAMIVQRHPDLIDGRIVCLGSPLRGSAASRSLKSIPGGSALLGRSFEVLEHGLERWDAPQQIGVIAGRLPLGLGFLLGGVSSPHDGTVAVEETLLPGITDHRVIAAAHTGLVFSEEAALHTTAFLRDGHFGTG